MECQFEWDCIFAILFTSITTPQITFFLDSQDARMSSLGWNQIKSGSWVLDRIPYRAVTIYGHSTRSSPASAPVDSVLIRNERIN